MYRNYKSGNKKYKKYKKSYKRDYKNKFSYRKRGIPKTIGSNQIQVWCQHFLELLQPINTQVPIWSYALYDLLGLSPEFINYKAMYKFVRINKIAVSYVAFNTIYDNANSYYLNQTNVGFAPKGVPANVNSLLSLPDVVSGGFYASKLKYSKAFQIMEWIPVLDIDNAQLDKYGNLLISNLLHRQYQAVANITAGIMIYRVQVTLTQQY